MNRQASIETLATNKRRGAALIVMMFVVVLASTAIFITLLAKTNPEIERQKKTIAALVQAKQALIAWSVTRGDMQPATTTATTTDPTTGAQTTTTSYTYYRPGSLPCPDTNYFGTGNSGFSAGSCSSSGGTSIGRLPWKSLRTEKLLDASGEPLWYAISDNFRRANGLNDRAINSDTKGSLLLYGTDGTTLVTPAGEELAAIVFSPGPPLSGQDRVTLPNAAKSYLDAFNGKDNANAAGPFIVGPIRDSNGNLISNDMVIGISAKELIAAVELRALKEAQNALLVYSATKGKYPNPARYNGTNCASIVTDVTAASIPLCASDQATCIGRLPEDVLEVLVAPWFKQNGWGRTMTYAIKDNAANCSTQIKVDGIEKSYVLIAPGVARAGQARPPPSTQQNLPSSLSNYLEDAGNKDAWTGNTDFVTPTSASNDHLRSAP